MADNRLGRHGFTVQESVNMECFADWNYEELDLSSASDTCSYITAIQPAKKVVIYYKPTGAASLDSDDVLTLTINGLTATEKKIKIDGGDLPFTLSGVIVETLSIATDDHDASEAVSVLSFH